MSTLAWVQPQEKHSRYNRLHLIYQWVAQHFTHHVSWRPPKSLHVYNIIMQQSELKLYWGFGVHDPKYLKIQWYKSFVGPCSASVSRNTQWAHPTEEDTLWICLVGWTKLSWNTMCPATLSLRLLETYLVNLKSSIIFRLTIVKFTFWTSYSKDQSGALLGYQNNNHVDRVN